MAPKPVRLARTLNGWSDGNLVIVFQSYNPPDTQRWFASWKDIFGVQRTVREYTRERLMERLRPYGMGRYTFARETK
jgi:hypothetical protein